MRIGRFVVGLGLGSFLLSLVGSLSGCGSAAVDTGPTLKDAPPAQAGQASSADFNKNRKKK